MNWESDNVWEWIDNDECLYNAMIEYTRTVDTPTYKGFIAWMGLEGQRTPDGVQWDGDGLTYAELNEMMQEHVPDWADIRIERLIEEIGIDIDYVPGADHIPESFQDSDAWTVTLTRDSGETFVTPFFKGRGHHGKPPTIEEVLECILSDAECWEDSQGDFEDWCVALGYDNDSIKALRIFEAMEEQTIKLQRFLGDKYDGALWGPEYWYS